MQDAVETLGTATHPVMMTLDNISKNIDMGCGGYYVWPHEGFYAEDGSGFVFHEGVVMDGATEVKCPIEPLYISKSTVAAVAVLVSSMKKSNFKVFVERFMVSRGLFVYVVNEFLEAYNIGAFDM